MKSTATRRENARSDDTLHALRVNPEWAKLPLFDRSKWQRVRFGDVVENVNETERDPQSAGIERFIGLEHLEPGSLHMNKWGNVADGTTFTRRCRPGQVLFGKRRAYQRKVAVAEFDAVVSGDIYVFAPKNDRLLPELLPFLCMSERFFKFAVETSAGSLSPRTNWSSLASFEFDLPPLDQQRRIAGILWTVDEVVTKTLAATSRANAVVEAKLNDFLYHQEKWRTAPTRDLLAEGPRNGFSPPAGENSSGLPTLSISAIRGGIVVPEGSLKYADVEPQAVAQFKLRKDDILVVRGNGNRLLCGRAGIVKDFPEGCFYPDLLIRLRFRTDALLPKFAVLHWNEQKTHLRLLKKAKSTNGIFKINGQDIQSHQLVAPPIVAQERFLKEMQTKTILADAFDRSAAEAATLQLTLINSIFR
jgi:type I restriction enzyme, S subunit